MHASAFLVCGVFLTFLNLATTPGVPWFTWSLFGWGIGVAMHTVGVLRFEMLSEEEKRTQLERRAAHYMACGQGCGCMKANARAPLGR